MLNIFKKLSSLGVVGCICSFALASNTPANPKKDSTQIDTNLIVIQQDDPVVLMLDQALLEHHYQAIQCNYDSAENNIYGFAFDSVPKYPDSVYVNALAELDVQTPFNLVYNARVKAFINLYAVKRREQTAKMLGLQNYYFPMFEQILDLYDIPQEMKYLAIVESALNPKARSRVGATGLWQFMYSTGKLYGLHQNSYMDERMDPIKSTHAACKYLKYLYGIYGKWDLVMAAYNCGPGNVNKAMRRSGSRDGNYWDLYPYLPRETRGYVPAFIAVNYIMNNAAEHNIYAVEPPAHFFEIDTVIVSNPIQLEEVAEITNTSLTYLSFLNPSYKSGYIPAYSNKTSFMILPKEKIGLYVQNEELVAKNSIKKEENNGTKTVQKFQEDRVVYRVRSGDYLGRIASRYSVSVGSIKRWNGLRSNNIRVGQRLVIYPKGTYTASNSSKKSIDKKNINSEGNYTYYTIQRGDTLWDIAKARGMSVEQLKKLNQNLNYRDIKPGTKVIIGSNG